ncbi:nucleotide sugar dehydrogenase [Flavobacteriaceae bacterium]|nr:nucleotide sugar dehydrogenase [Flavobacteriaceae bacterium]
MKDKIGIVGLGYVGLPLAVEMNKKHSVLGYDIDIGRVSELNKGIDKTNEITPSELKKALDNNITFINDSDKLNDVTFFIVTVPTPINKDKTPNLNPIISASKIISKFLKDESIVVYESTVYPGVTEDICVPILEEGSGLTFNKDFFVGYSPERINPGDKEHTVTKIKKVVSGSTPNALRTISEVYGSIIEAGIYEAESIKVAEAAKVIENTQRDINIAFINELSVIFNKMEINIHHVLNAAETKWNFLKFKPGIVGGHCIGVDPYYLAHKSKELDINPEMILAGRRINDSMAEYIFNLILKKSIKNKLDIKNTNYLIYGLTFKENCPDFRNSQSLKVYEEFKKLNLNIRVYDPYLSESIDGYYGSDIIYDLDEKVFDSILLLVPHKELDNINLKDHLSSDGFLFDLKNFYDSDEIADLITL